MEASHDDASAASLSGIKKRRKKRSKRYRSTYNEENIHMAYILVTEKKKSIRKAALSCGVPFQTLRDRLGRGVNAPCYYGGPPLLPREEEEKLVNHITLQASSGHSPTRKEIIHLATETAVLLGKKSANSGQLTKRWYCGFQKRWPQLSLAKTKSLVSQETVTSYFDKLDNILTNSNIRNKPQCMFYVEETCFQPESKPGDSVEPCNPKDKDKTLHKGPRTSVFSCGTAQGTCLPLYIVFEGEITDEMLSDNAIPGSNIVTMNGRCTKPEIFKRFVKDHFIPHLPQKMSEEPVLLFYDRCLSYISATLIEFCRTDNIILFARPTHTSETTHPHGSSLFKPLKTFFQKDCQKQLEKKRPGVAITRFDICRHACTRYLEACTPLSRINFFKEIGIFPLNPH